jgi:cation:H+ antiporter
LQLIELAFALVIILLAAELFTNGIEWFGHRLDLAEGAVGSVLAAVGTALPETMIPLVAFLFAGRLENTDAAHGVGVGAILGAPFMLSTLAMFITGVGVIAFRRRRKFGSVMPVSTRVLFTDIRYFFIAYAIAIMAAFVPSGLVALRYVAVVSVLAIYVWYVRSHFSSEESGSMGADMAPLRLHRIDQPGYRRDPAVPRLRVINLQVVLAVSMIVGGALLFVDAVEHIALGAGLDPVLLSLVVAPIATELPEKFNSLIWVRQGKDTLAMGNITGAMVFQSCIPTAIGIVLATGAWTVTQDTLLSFVSAGIAFASTALIFVPMARRGRLSGTNLLIGGAFYVLYVALVVGHLAGLL